jgi:hypothetical protein
MNFLFLKTEPIYKSTFDVIPQLRTCKYVGLGVEPLELMTRAYKQMVPSTPVIVTLGNLLRRQEESSLTFLIIEFVLHRKRTLNQCKTSG